MSRRLALHMFFFFFFFFKCALPDLKIQNCFLKSLDKPIYSKHLNNVPLLTWNARFSPRGRPCLRIAKLFLTKLSLSLPSRRCLQTSSLILSGKLHPLSVHFTSWLISVPELQLLLLCYLSHIPSWPEMKTVSKRSQAAAFKCFAE